MNTEHSKVTIEVQENVGDGEYSLVSHTSGSVGKVTVGRDLGIALKEIWCRCYLALAEAVLEQDDNEACMSSEIGDAERKLIEAAHEVVTAWEKYDFTDNDGDDE